MAISDIQWATDTNFTNGPDVGTPTKVEPSAGVKAEGHVPGTILPAQRLNWHLNRLGEEASYVDDVLNADVNHFTKSSKYRTIVLDPVSIAPLILSTGLANWFGTPLESRADFGRAFIPLRGLVPHGARITSTEIIWHPGAARGVGERCEISYVEATVNFTTAEIPSYTIVASQDSSGTATRQVTSLTVGGGFLVDSSKLQYIAIDSGLDGATNTDLVYAVGITFEDPGPRNF